MTLEFSKSMRWSNDHACFAMLDPLAYVLTFLTCSFLRVSKHQPQLVGSNSFAVLPFINGVTQPLTRILRRHDIQVVNKPLKTLQQEFPSPKFRPPIEHQPNVVYKIPCADCGWCYVGKTGRCFETRKKEHARNVKTYANGSNIAKHAWSFDHRIDIDNSSVIDKGSFHIRKTLEAWHTSATKHADNNSKPLPNQYCILFKQ